MLTIRAMVKKDGLRADQTYNVKVCFTYKRKVKRLSTSLFASAEDLTKSLNFKEGPRPVHPIFPTEFEFLKLLRTNGLHYLRL